MIPPPTHHCLLHDKLHAPHKTNAISIARNIALVYPPPLSLANPQEIHEPLIKTHYGEKITGHVSRNARDASSVTNFVQNDLFRLDVNFRAGTWYLGRAIQYWSAKPNPLPYVLAG